jgi:deferrochelatase/peroxidase EfeB
MSTDSGPDVGNGGRPGDGGTGTDRGLSRRSLLAGGLVAGGLLGGALVGGVSAVRGGGHADEAATFESDVVANAHDGISFEGTHQAGIATPQQAAAIFAALDVVTPDRASLAAAFQMLTEESRFLTAGGTPPVVSREQPASDSGLLGPTVVPDDLTITVGVGASLFDDRFGLGSCRPTGLVAMPVFPNDRLDPTQTHGDVLLQICANSADTCLHALRELLRRTRGAFAVRWKIDGFHQPSKEQPGGTTRNLLAFKDGTANPLRDDPAHADQLLWAGPSQIPSAVGGSFQVVRVIRMLVEFWDRVSLSEQEEMIGRRRDTGAPLDGKAEFDVPHYQDDPAGAVIPFTAHIRLANPRTAASEPTQILRRGYNYSKSIDSAGNLDMGLVFCAFCADVHRQFEAVQGRLNGEPLEDYVKPVGGGYFFALPGVAGRSDWLGSGLFT